MSQYDFGTIDPATKSGAGLADLINQYRGASNSSHSGAVRPSYVVGGMVWIDTSSDLWRVNLYDGSSDVRLMTIDPVGHTPIVGVGAEVDVASTTTVNLAQAKSNLVRITGTTTIEGFGAGGAGVLRQVQFADILTLKQSGSLDLPGGADIVTAANDRALFVGLGSGVWRCIAYTRANGLAVVNRDASVAQYRAKADRIVTAKTAFDAADYVALTDAATIAVDLATGINFKVSLGAARTLGFPTNRKTGQTGRIKVTPNAFGLSFASGYIFTNGQAPTISGKTYLDYFVDDDDTVHVMASRNVA